MSSPTITLLKTSIYMVIIAAAVTYFAIHRITLYRNTVEIELLRARFEAYVTLHDAKDAGQDDRITALEKTVYVAPDAKESRKPAALEQWIFNAGEDLRKRVKALEEWRYREDRHR